MKQQLVIAHMNDDAVVIVPLDGSLAQVIPGVPAPGGVVAADDVAPARRLCWIP